MMRIDILTLFPEMCEGFLRESIIGRAISAGKIEVYCHNIRHFTDDKHKRVDDAPYGGGMGMVMRAQPIFDCYKHVCNQRENDVDVYYLSPKGKVFTQSDAVIMSKTDGFILLCGHYEGVDQRVLDAINAKEISIGDYVLTGGELPAVIVTDAVCRLVEGVLSSEECFIEESHYNSLLEHPHYTRPEEWHEMKVPDLLISGHHENIAKWRREMSIITTMHKREDMLKNAELTKKEKEFVKNLQESGEY